MNLEAYLRELIHDVVRQVVQEELESRVLQTARSLDNQKTSDQATVSKKRDPNSIIRPSELSNILSVSKATLWRWENKGQLPSRIKISNRAVGWRYKDIDQWLNRREAKGFNQTKEK